METGSVVHGDANVLFFSGVAMEGQRMSEKAFGHSIAGELNDRIEEVLQIAGELGLEYTVEYLTLAEAACQRELADAGRAGQRTDDTLRPTGMLN